LSSVEEKTGVLKDKNKHKPFLFKCFMLSALWQQRLAFLEFDFGYRPYSKEN
jgi:hypothetical protein